MGCEEKYETTRSHVPTRQQQQQQQTTPSHHFLQHNINFHLELEQKTIGHFFFLRKKKTQLEMYKFLFRCLLSPYFLGKRPPGCQKCLPVLAKNLHVTLTFGII